MEKQYTLRTMDTIAHKVLKEYDKTLVTGEPREIPIEEIIEFHYDLRLEYKYLTKDCTIQGMCVFEDCQLPIYNPKTKAWDICDVLKDTILIDKRLLAKNKRQRLRFTMAHELAHHILHKEYFLECEEVASKSNQKDTTQQENEADELAASLLLPSGRVKMAMKRLEQKGDSKKIAFHIANIFGVSQRATDIRVKQFSAI